VSERATEILYDLVSSLRASELFALVTLGGCGSSGGVPRAAVLLEGQDFFQADDCPATLWVRLRVRIAIHLRSDDSAESIDRAGQLCASSVQALLSDPYRGQRCKDLPMGRATEIGRTELVPGLKRPEAEVTLTVRCHFEIQGQP
jgi:hypothetical protein